MEIGSIAYLIVTTTEAEHRKRVDDDGREWLCRTRGEGGEGEEEVAVWRGHRVESTALPQHRPEYYGLIKPS